MSEPEDRRVREAVADAVAAFDAANLAWGQFYQYVWAARPLADRRRAEPVREALGEAALSVPAGSVRAEIAAFAAALAAARERTVEFLSLADASERAELQQIPEALLEAVERLAPFLA